MSFELENMWDAMKQSHYRRTLEAIEAGIEGAANPYEAMETALNQVASAVHAEAGTFWFYDRFGDDLIHATAVFGGGDISDITLMPGEGIAGSVIKNGLAVIVEDCSQDPRWSSRADRNTGFVTRTMICVPLKIEDITFGSIQIINKTDGLKFDGYDLDFAQELAKASAQMLSSQELLKGYIVYAGRETEDNTTFESIMYAPTYQAAERLLKRTNCYQILNAAEKSEAEKLLNGMYEIFDAALERKDGPAREEDTKKRGLFGKKR